MLETCKSIGDADGRWVSLCVPQVKENEAILPKDDAHPGEACVPCINPIDKTETGVCFSGDCGAGAPAAPAAPAAAPAWPPATIPARRSTRPFSLPVPTSAAGRVREQGPPARSPTIRSSRSSASASPAPASSASRTSSSRPRLRRPGHLRLVRARRPLHVGVHPADRRAGRPERPRQEHLLRSSLVRALLRAHQRRAHRRLRAPLRRGP